MKTFMITSVLAALSLSTAVSAAEFGDTGASVVLERNNMTLGVASVAGEATSLSFGVAVLPHGALGADADMTLGLGYGIITEDLTFSAAYGLSKHYDKLNVYGNVEAAYTVASGEANGDWDVTPTVGTAYRVNDKLAVFGEASYSWDVSNDWNSTGGALEVGTRYALSDDIAFTPSIVRTFDTGADATNLNVEVALRF